MTNQIKNKGRNIIVLKELQSLLTFYISQVQSLKGQQEGFTARWSRVRIEED
jgi:hypothetical protein